jgi:hypothetical protein
MTFVGLGYFIFRLLASDDLFVDDNTVQRQTVLLKGLRDSSLVDSSFRQLRLVVLACATI